MYLPVSTYRRGEITYIQYRSYYQQYQRYLEFDTKETDKLCKLDMSECQINPNVDRDSYKLILLK